MSEPYPSSDLADVPQLLKRAEAAMKAPGFLGQLFGREADYDTAVELLQQCAQRYKLARMFLEASSCYMKAAEAAFMAKDCHSEASMYVEAGNCVRRCSLRDSVSTFNRGIAVLIHSGRLAAAAKVHKMLAEEFEATGDRTTAAEHYMKAAGLFETDEFSKSLYSCCICKYAELTAWGGEAASGEPLAQTEALRSAANIFEEEGFKASQSNLLQYGAKDLFLKAMIVRLAIPRRDIGDVVDLQLAIDRYSERNVHFTSSREAQLSRQLVQAAENKDADGFASAVEKYDAISRLDPWKVHILLRAKALLVYDGDHAQTSAVAVDEDGHVDLS